MKEGATVTLELQGNDVSSAVAAYATRTDAANGPGDPDAVTFPLGGRAPPGYMRVEQQIQLPPGQGPKVIAAYLRDRAGNTSPPTLVEVVVDSRAPRLADGESLVATPRPAPPGECAVGIARWRPAPAAGRVLQPLCRRRRRHGHRPRDRGQWAQRRLRGPASR